MVDGGPMFRRREDNQPRRLRRGMYILPSLFTAANVLLGYYAILQVIHGAVQYGMGHPEAWHFDNAAKAIGFAVLFDGLDGRILVEALADGPDAEHMVAETRVHTVQAGAYRAALQISEVAGHRYIDKSWRLT